MLSENIGLVDPSGRTIYRRESMLIGEKGNRALNESPHFDEDKDEIEPEKAKLKMSEDALKDVHANVNRWHRQNSLEPEMASRT